MKTLILEPTKHALAVLTLIALMLLFLNQFYISAKTIRMALATPTTVTQDLDETLEHGSAEFKKGFEACQSQF